MTGTRPERGNGQNGTETNYRSPAEVILQKNMANNGGAQFIYN